MSTLRPSYLPYQVALHGTCTALAVLLAACASGPVAIIPAPLDIGKAPVGPLTEQGALSQRREAGIKVTDTPQLPEATRISTVKPAASPEAEGPADTTLSFDQLPLPSFVNVVFGSILKKNFSVDPAVMARTDLVTLRTGTPQSPAQVLEVTKMALKTYGIAVTELGGFYRIAPDSNLSSYAPEIRRGRAQPEVPMPLRPVFQLVELSAVRFGDVSTWLKAMFGTRVTIQEDGARNALLLTAQPADLTAALEAIQVLDQPLMRGRGSRLVTPASLGADDLARKLVEVLQAEGYAAAVSGGTTTPISLIPVPASNSLLVFAVDPAVLGHVIDWAQKLDTLDNDNRRNGSFFSYKVKYTDAQNLARTMQELLSAAATATPAGIGTAPKPAGRIVVNAATNTLIFTSTPSEYAQLVSIMKDLDQPAKSALVEVTVAEVRVTDKQQLGIEWAMSPQGVGTGSIIGGTLGGLGQAKDGLSFSYLNNASVVRANLNALASKNRANILSTPRIMARNGETATIQVGQEVPVVTSQQSTGLTTTPGTGGSNNVSNGVLQSIQYRNTGVILRVKPVIFAGNRVELDVSQEVSSAAETKSGVTSTPTISSRKLETKLSIKDGATVLLGGLMSRNDSKADTGIPILKDLPGIGQLFRTNVDSEEKTELIMLITPYVIDDDLVAEQVTQAVRKQAGAWAAPQVLPGLGLKPVVEDAAAMSATSGRSEPVPTQQSVPSGVSAVPLQEAPPTRDVGSQANPPAPVRASGAEAAPAASGEAQKMPVGAQPSSGATVPKGREVTDPELLEELRRAATQGASVKPAITPQPSSKKPVKKAPAAASAPK